MARDTSQLRRLARGLSERRLFAYAVGLAVVTFPRAAESLGVTVGSTVRTLFLVLGLGLMVTTYVAELWVGFSSNPGDSGSDVEGGYSTRARLLIAFAGIGIAIGVYVALTVDRFTGLLFVGGALLIGQHAFRHGRGDDEAEVTDR